MLFKAPSKGDDGIYYARATTDDRKKVFLQLNKLTVRASSESQVTFKLTHAARKKIVALDEDNLQQALENAESWFGREMTKDALTAAYFFTVGQVSGELTADRIAPTKVFSSEAEIVDFSAIKKGSKVNAIVEFVGLYFAKTSFGPIFNVVQVKIHADPVPEYPSEFAFAASDDDDEVEEEIIPTQEEPTGEKSEEETTEPEK